MTWRLPGIQRTKKNPDLLVVSREDGRILNSIPVDGYPSFMIATRDGKLLCYAGK